MQDKYWFFDNETKCQKFWAEHNINKFDINSTKEVYSIDTPPPTVSWKIHIWHIFSYTQAEVIARFKKMMGYNVFYPFGFDDNGLPTERLVEKEIWKKWSELSREEFILECLKITDEYRNKFKNLWISMWFSVDWDLSYSTISQSTQKVSQNSFLSLINKWIIYRKEAPALWCHECQTAIAQAEVEKKELDGIFYDIEFNLSSDLQPLTISTTRPELLPACVAVFVNSEDERYRRFIWKEIITPFWKTVKIIWDDKVDREKWSWVVMCCTYWDETDMYWAKKYCLDEKIILDSAWKIINTWDIELDGVYYKKARKIIIEKIAHFGKLLSSKNIKHDVWCHERCGTPIEILTVKQWFIKTIDIKDDLIQAWNEINWNPPHMKKRYIEWVENLKWDWCISRQRFFWIPIPVWYSKKTWEIILPQKDQLPINPLNSFPSKLPDWHTNDDIVGEEDVLDTWATSSLTPLVNSCFFENDNRNQKILPMSLRPQAHDIIRTWALYTIIMSHYHTWTIPFKDIMISGHVLAWKWEKISKSKNNAGTTPEELIKKYWADPVRYWASWWNLWKDIVFDEKEIQNWQRLITKLWNASKLVIINLENYTPPKDIDFTQLQEIDKWIIYKTLSIAEKMKKSFESFNVWLSIIDFEKFFWSDFCDNYLEIVKWKMLDISSWWNEIQISSQHWLYFSLFNILKLISPILPHISEEIYQNYYKKFEKEISIHNFSYPFLQESDISMKDLNLEVEKLFEVFDWIRKYKTNNEIKYWQETNEISIFWEDNDIQILKKYKNELLSISRSKNIYFSHSPVLNVCMK